MKSFLHNVEYIFEKIKNYRALGFSDYKYSYLIVKPNGVKHFQTYVEELKKRDFVIINFFAIRDYEKLNIALHPTQKEQRHIVPINNMFKDYYSNYAILILIAKKNVTYKDLVCQVYCLKTAVRKQFETDYISYVFDISELLQDNQHQSLKIIDTNNEEVSKREMNHEGTFLVFSINSLHSPDPKVDVTISELQLIYKERIFCKKNIIPRSIINAMMKYETFAFIKEM